MKFHAGQPDVEQQQIVEDFGKADSTMRILERLIEKEQEVYKTIGDAAVLLGLHDSAREEEYLTQGAASGKAAEELLPAHPQEPAWWQAIMEQVTQEVQAADLRSEALSLFPGGAGGGLSGGVAGV